MIYLASPYSAGNVVDKEAIEQYRYEAAVGTAIDIMRELGEMVFSPIAHSHYIHKQSGGDIGGGWEQWAEFDRKIIAACDKFFILKLPGWEQSEGIKRERAIAEALGLPIMEIASPEERRGINYRA